MKTLTKEVKTKGKIVGQAVVDCPETLDEMTEYFKDDFILDRFGAQIVTDECNDIRAKAQPSTTKKAIEDRSWELCAEGGELYDDFIAASQNPATLKDFLETAKARAKEVLEEESELIGADAE